MHLNDEFEVAVVLVGAKLVGADKPPLAPGHVLNAARRLDDAVEKVGAVARRCAGEFLFGLARWRQRTSRIVRSTRRAETS